MCVCYVHIDDVDYDDLCSIEESPKTISLKEELETKRCQLEIEIDRFKREHAAISKLRLEREEVSNTYYVYTLMLFIF